MPVGFLLSLAVVALLQPPARAQEFRIYTLIHQEAFGPKPGTPSRVVARTLTLFHARKAYDYIEKVNEVIIFEPANHRFTILSPSRSMMTRVDLNDLNGMLTDARGEIQQYLARPQNAEGPNREVAKALKFQLQPDFKPQYDKPRQTLTLASPFVRYEASCVEPKSPEALTSYLRYADWTCRLNYVLHPQTLYPEPRLALNNALRQQLVMPVEVRLSIAGANPIKLRAEHKIHWNLSPSDRSLIHHWETKLKDRKTRRVSFREYQRAMLVSLSKRDR